jgi:hypothetical protein
MRIIEAFFDEEGFSTIGVVLALLLSLALIFSSAQVYRICTTSSSIQETADAAALSAENVVAEYYIAVRICDAVVLSMNLTGSIAMGVGVAALCVPASSGIGSRLIAAGERIFQSRDSFVRTAEGGLNKVQRALPFLAAVSAASVVKANADADGAAGYFGFALLLPQAGEEVAVDGVGSSRELVSQVEGSQGQLTEAARKAEEAAQRANQAKERAFLADCGNNPGYCMYERARKLAVLADEENPRYQTVDAWNFSVALRRAQAYYPARLAKEEPLDDSVEEQSNSALRKRFYRYASDQVSHGFVVENGDSFSARFPLLPRNTDEMRQTALYTETVYPITESHGKKTMHAWAGCPRAGNPVAVGSIKDLDEGDFATCDQCRFAPSSMGKVAAASSTIQNGFEYHYRIVAEAAREYQASRAEGAPSSKKAKRLAAGMLSELKEFLKRSAGMRIKAHPPGRYGSVSIVATTKPLSSDYGFQNSFVKGGSTLGTRAAVSGAVLASDSPTETESIISSLLNGVERDTGSLVATGTDGLLDAWSSLLFAYTKGQSALEQGLEETLNGIPLVGASGLGTWASDKLTRMIDELGLEPAKLDAPKPILSNSAHPLEQDSSAFSSRFLQVKRHASWLGGNDVFSGPVSAVEQSAIQKVNGIDDTITIATIEPFGETGPSLPITVTLPPSAKSTTIDVISEIATRLQSIGASISGVTQWR